MQIKQSILRLYQPYTRQKTSQANRGYEFDIGLWFKPLINQNKPKMAKNDKKFNFSILQSKLPQICQEYDFCHYFLIFGFFKPFLGKILQKKSQKQQKMTKNLIFRYYSQNYRKFIRNMVFVFILSFLVFLNHFLAKKH